MRRFICVPTLRLSTDSGIGRKIATSSLESDRMEPTTKEKLLGVAHEAEGEIKEVVGKLLEKPDIEKEGQKEKIAGRVERSDTRRKQPSATP
jgi:uncharacterized protein YjbJ (UPF0337 family)